MQYQNTKNQIQAQKIKTNEKKFQTQLFKKNIFTKKENINGKI